MFKVKRKHMAQLGLILFLVALGIFIIHTSAVSSQTVVASPPVGIVTEDLRVFWEPLPDTITRQTNTFGGARTWNLSEDLSLHMCWCYGVRITHLNTERFFDGDVFDGHTVWSRPGSNDIMLTDHTNYFAMFDYERRITSTFAREGTRSYRFHNWSAYFFSDGTLTVTDSYGSVVVMENGMFLIDPIEDWRFEVTVDFLIDLDQQFMMKLLTHNLPWSN